MPELSRAPIVTKRVELELFGSWGGAFRMAAGRKGQATSRRAREDTAKIPTQNPTIMVGIQCHTDSIGSDKYNQELSERRAQAVVNYLVQDLGIEAGRLTAKGCGEFRPVADNSTEAGRSLNRRVEFVITGKTGQIAPDR